MQTKFNPTLSFDGVAMIVGILTCCVWLGTLNQKVEQNSKDIAEHKDAIKILSETTATTARNTAVLQQMVQDRITHDTVNR